MTHPTLHRLSRTCSRAFALPRDSVRARPPLSPTLLALYEQFNGGFFWERALLIRPAAAVHGAPTTVERWNELDVWKGLYGDACQEVMFFAEDAFGVQFGLRGDAVVQFDPETASVAECGSTLEEWVSLLVREPDYYTGFPVLAAWERDHQELDVGFRLIPKQLFSLGGDFHSANMVRKADVEGMRLRAQFWDLTKDLADGQKIKFRIDE